MDTSALITPVCASNRRTQSSCFTISVAAMYYASHVERLTVRYGFDA